MEDNHVIPGPESPQETRSEQDNSKKIIFIVMGVVAFLGVGIFAFLAGSKNTDETSDMSPTPTEAIEETTNTPSPTEADSLSPTTTKALTPTKKPTLTPTATPSPTPVIKTKIISATASLDGFRSSNNGGNEGVEIRAGRNENLVTRGFVSFSISEIPSGSTITEATLRLYQGQIIGNPYTAGGALKIDHLNYGDSLDSSDYGVGALSSSFATLTSNEVKEWKDATVTSQVKDDISSSRSRSQFRIHFTTENTGGTLTGDFTYFESADNNMGTGNTPQLVVKYY